MVHHMVWIKFHDGVSEPRQREHLDALAALRETVPGVTNLAVGENFTDRARGFTHGLLVSLESQSALKVYANHPAHVPAAKALSADAELLAMDFESDAG